MTPELTGKITRIVASVRAGQRLSGGDALTLYRQAPTGLLGTLADEVPTALEEGCLCHSATLA